MMSDTALRPIVTVLCSASDRFRTVVRSSERRLRSPAWLSRAAAVGLCIASLGFTMALTFAIASDGQIALITKPLSMRIALAFSPLVLAFTVGTVVGAGLGWWHRYWTPGARIHQTILALLGVGFVWQLAVLGFLG